jgi:hypothetical protein
LPRSRALIYIAETAAPDERERMRPIAVTLLYLITDRTDDASRELGRLYAKAAERPKNASCDKTLSHGSFLSHMFRFRSRRRNR